MHIISDNRYIFFKNPIKDVKILFIIITQIMSYSSFCQQRVLPYSIYDQKKLGPIVMESTFFLYDPNNSENSGTCFILAHIIDYDTTLKFIDSTYLKVDSTKKFRFPKFKYCEVLVTAAHVFKNISGDYANISLRKKKGNDYEIFDARLKIKENGSPLWIQLDNKTDIAAIPIFLPDTVTYKILDDSYLLFGNRLKQIGLETGDDLSCVGYPYYTPSDKRYFPVLRSGKYASYLGPHSYEDPYFLFDFKIYPGNSGGPVFVDYKATTEPGFNVRFTAPGIIGIVSEQLKSIDNKYTLEIAKVVPSQYIHQTILKIKNVPNEFIKSYDEQILK